MTAEAEARAARNGLTLEYGDRDDSPAWPGVRFASVHLMRGVDQVASCAHSYRDATGRKRALSFCAFQVFNAPARVA